jgi:hypothetical protein
MSQLPELRIPARPENKYAGCGSEGVRTKASQMESPEREPMRRRNMILRVAKYGQFCSIFAPALIVVERIEGDSLYWKRSACMGAYFGRQNN